MRNKILRPIIRRIQKECPEYSQEEIDVVRYGLESLYISITKTIVLTLLAYVIGIIKEYFIFLLFFGCIRSSAFGLHAKKSWMCYISSFICMILVPLGCVHFQMNLYLHFILAVLCTGYIYKYAPADTENRPIVSEKRRKILKIISTVTATVFSTISFFVTPLYSNIFICVLLVQCIMISPQIYRLFHLPYNNYLDYLEQMS